MEMEQFKKNPKTEKAINTLYESIRELPYDQRISWGELNKRTGTTLSVENLYYVVQRVNDLMMANDSKYMETVHGFGKRIINPSEHSTVARKKVRKSVKIYRKAGAILASTNMDELNEDQKTQILSDAKKWQTLELVHNELLKKKEKKLTTEQKESKIMLDMISLLKS